MEILGRDIATESYRVRIAVEDRQVSAYVPERMAASMRFIADRPSHQTAYVWIAAHEKEIEAAIAKLARGLGRPKAPYDQITLIEEH